MQRYKCNVEMVFSGQMNNIIERDVIRSTDCMHAALANSLFELIMVRGGVLSLPTWFSRYLMMFCLVSVFSAGYYCFHCSYCMTVCRVLRVRFYNK